MDTPVEGEELQYLRAVNAMQTDALLRIMRRLGLAGAFNSEVADEFIRRLDLAEKRAALLKQ